MSLAFREPRRTRTTCGMARLRIVTLFTSASGVLLRNAERSQRDERRSLRSSLSHSVLKSFQSGLH